MQCGDSSSLTLWPVSRRKDETAIDLGLFGNVFHVLDFHFDVEETRKTPKEKKPPKLKRRTLSSRCNASSPYEALSISFQKSPEPSKPCQSPLQKSSYDTTYFSDNFVDIKKIGEGSFGEVFQAKCVETNSVFAIKRTKEPFSGGNDRKTKLEEVRKHEMIPKHENCVEFVAAWEEQNHLYIQLELCRMSLYEYSETHPHLSDSTLWTILFDLLSAVNHLHDHNLIHLDIKLENILIALNGRYKLGDFGLVVDLTKDNIADAVEGDAKYLAPELMSGLFTKAADVFSVGITMLELATDLELPSRGGLWHELRNGIFPEELTSRVCPELLNLIKCMMNPHFVERPSVDELFKHPRLATMKLERMRMDRSLCTISYANTMYKHVLSACKFGISAIRTMIRRVFLGRDNSKKQDKENVRISGTQAQTINRDSNGLRQHLARSDDYMKGNNQSRVNRVLNRRRLIPVNLSEKITGSMLNNSHSVDFDSFTEDEDVSGSKLCGDISPIVGETEENSSFRLNESNPTLCVTKNSTPSSNMVPTTPRKRSATPFHGTITPQTKRFCKSSIEQREQDTNPLKVDQNLDLLGVHEDDELERPLKPRNLLSVFHDC